MEWATDRSYCISCRRRGTPSAFLMQNRLSLSFLLDAAVDLRGAIACSFDPLEARERMKESFDRAGEKSKGKMQSGGNY